jgi:hypothetical protein
MVTITNYFLRTNKEGKPFISLELTGPVEMIQSMFSGKLYATAKRCTVSSTFCEDVAKMLVGTKLPGRIDRVETEPYEYTAPGSTEKVILNHTYVYVPEERQPVKEQGETMQVA